MIVFSYPEDSVEIYVNERFDIWSFHLKNEDPSKKVRVGDKIFRVESKRGQSKLSIRKAVISIFEHKRKKQ